MGREPAGLRLPPEPRILVARPDHLGDLLLTLPALAALRRRLPAATISCLVPASLLPVTRRAPDVDDGVAMPLSIEQHPSLAGAGVVERSGAELRGRFDLALLPRPQDPWSGALVTAARVPVRVGHNQPGMNRFLTHAFPEHRRRHVAREAVVLALRAVRLLGVRAAPSRPRPMRLIEPLPSDTTEALALLDRLGLGGRAPVVVHPSTGWPLKNWPPRRWGEVVARLAERLRTPVLVVGRPTEREVVEEVVRASGGIGLAVHELSLGGLAALHQRSSVVVGTDSGALHLAALLGAPVVALYGPFGPSRVGVLAPASRWRALSVLLPCSPCGTQEQPPCGAARDPLCLSAIAAADVVDAAEELALDSTAAFYRARAPRAPAAAAVVR